MRRGDLNGQTVFTHGVEFGVARAASRAICKRRPVPGSTRLGAKIPVSDVRATNES